MGIEKFQSLLREKLGVDEESIKRNIKREIKRELTSELSEKFGEREDKYLETYIDSIRGEKEIKESKRDLKGNNSFNLSKLSRELDFLEKRLERRAYPD